MATLARLQPEQILLRWLNHHIRGYLATHPNDTDLPTDYAVIDLDVALSDGVALTLVLAQVLSELISSHLISSYLI